MEQTRDRQMHFQPTEHRDQIIDAFKAGKTLEQVATEIPVSRRTLERYFKDYKAGKFRDGAQTAGAQETGGKQTAQKETTGGKLVTFAVASPAPVVFTLGRQNIGLDAQDLYESYILYLDVKEHLQMEDSFSAFLKDGASVIWQILVNKPVVTDGKVEVKHGDGSRESEAKNSGE